MASAHPARAARRRLVPGAPPAAAQAQGRPPAWLQGYDVNPCHSKLHPAFTEAGIEPEEEEELPVQEAYTPESTCFGCGEASALWRCAAAGARMYGRPVSSVSCPGSAARVPCSARSTAAPPQGRRRQRGCSCAASGGRAPSDYD